MGPSRTLPLLLLAAGCSRSDPASTAPPTASAAGLPAPWNTPVDIEVARAEVRAAFNNYRKAVAAQRGEEAVRFVSAKTLDRYEELRVAALQMPESKLRVAPLLDKVIILSTRARLTRAQLEGLTGKDLFVMGIDRGWTGDDVAHVEPAEVHIDGESARIGLRKGTTTVPSAAGVRAYREGSAWKVDITSVHRIAELALRKQLREVADDEDQALQQLIEILVDKKVGPAIWHPLAK